MNIFVPSLIPLTYTFIFILTLTNFPTSLSHHSKEYKTCNKTFNCGNLTDLSYPFYGLDRPSYCGHPGFELLDCDQQTELIKIAILSQQFYVIGINSTSSTINVSREDYYKRSGCPMTLTNITIDFSIFQYTSVDENITLLYGNCSSSCSNSTQLKSMVYPCPMSSTENLPVCYLTREMMSRNNISHVSCPNNTLFLPIHKSDYEAADKSEATIDVSRGVWHGFELKWNAKDELCQECLRSGGQCGHDWSSNNFFCFCPDESKCPFPGSTSDNKTLSKPEIAIIASFSSMGIGLIIILACYIKWKCSSTSQELEDRKQDIEAFLRNYGSSGPKRYTYTDLKRITNSFKDKLGEGGYGTVYKGILHNGQLVAVKILKKTEGDTGEFINEVASIGMTNHVNVVTLLGFCYEVRERALVYEFMPNGSLEKFVYPVTDTNQPLDWQMLFQIATGIARGLEYLHRGCNTRILHFDIKPHNILLDENFCPKISDFGLAKSCPQKDSIISMSEARGTIGYIAPEVFLRSFGGVSYKSDVYSYGMLVLEMVGCRKRAEVDSEVSNEQYFPQWIYEQLEKGEETDDEETLNWEERELQRKMIMVSLWCVQTNPSNRPAMSKVVEMLEGTLDSLQIPPAVSMSSSLMSQMNCSTSTTIST